jgi:hypothetical protein
MVAGTITTKAHASKVIQPGNPDTTQQKKKEAGR